MYAILIFIAPCIVKVLIKITENTDLTLLKTFKKYFGISDAFFKK